VVVYCCGLAGWAGVVLLVFFTGFWVYLGRVCRVGVRGGVLGGAGVCPWGGVWLGRYVWRVVGEVGCGPGGVSAVGRTGRVVGEGLGGVCPRVGEGSVGGVCLSFELWFFWVAAGVRSSAVRVFWFLFGGVFAKGRGEGAGVGVRGECWGVESRCVGGSGRERVRAGGERG